MPTTSSRIRAGIIAELNADCEAVGIRLNKHFDELGIDRACLGQPNMLIPLNAAMALFDRVAQLRDDTHFGLSFAERFTPGASGISGILIMCAPNVRVALTQLVRLAASFSPQLRATFEECDGVGRFEWVYPDDVTAPRRQFVSFVAASIVRRVREGAVADWQPLLVEFDHRAPDDVAPYRTFFGDRLRFDAPCNAIVFDGAILSRDMKRASPVHFDMAVDLAERWIGSDHNAPGIVANTRAAIAAILARGTPTLDNVARSLDLTSSQLQRRLEQAETSFERVLNDMRADLARHLLHNTDKSITEIAFELGFTDPSTFSRASRRWFQVTPLKFRRTSRGSKALRS